MGAAVHEKAKVRSSVARRLWWIFRMLERFKTKKPPTRGDGGLEIGGRFADYFTPFFERRVPGVAPWRALNFGFDLQIT